MLCLAYIGPVVTEKKNVKSLQTVKQTDKGQMIRNTLFQFLFKCNLFILTSNTIMWTLIKLRFFAISSVFQPFNSGNKVKININKFHININKTCIFTHISFFKFTFCSVRDTWFRLLWSEWKKGKFGYNWLNNWWFAHHQ